MGFCGDCCRGLASGFLLILNSLSMIGGLALLGLGGYAYATREKLAGTLGQTEEFVAPTMIGLMATGGAVFLVSLLGFSGARKRSRAMLGIYLFFMVIVAIVQLASGSFFFVTIGTLRDISTHNSNTFAKDSLAARINDYQLALYNTCCHVEYPSLTTKAELCDKATCSTIDRCACIVDEEYYDSWQDLEHDMDVMCDAMANVTVIFEDHKTPIVGSPANADTSGACGNGEPKVFQHMVYELFQSIGQPIGAAVMIIAGIEIAAILFASMLCCCFPKTKLDENHKEEEDRLMEA